MKALFYVGAVLMTGAVIYGFVDYNKSRHSQEFMNLYKIETPAAAKNIATPVNTFDANENKQASGANVNSGSSEKTNFNPGTIAPLTSKPVKKKKSINYKSFSRARIVEALDKEPKPVIKVQRQ